MESRAASLSNCHDSKVSHDYLKRQTHCASITNNPIEVPRSNLCDADVVSDK